MTQDNKPRGYHFGTDIPIPTMREVDEARRMEAEYEAADNRAFVIMIIAFIVALSVLAYVLKLALFGG